MLIVLHDSTHLGHVIENCQWFKLASYTSCGREKYAKTAVWSPLMWHRVFRGRHAFLSSLFPVLSKTTSFISWSAALWVLLCHPYPDLGTCTVVHRVYSEASGRVMAIAFSAFYPPMLHNSDQNTSQVQQPSIPVRPVRHQAAAQRGKWTPRETRLLVAFYEQCKKNFSNPKIKKKTL